MKSLSLPYLPVEGKTYSLFGDYNSTLVYFQTIRKLADVLMTESCDLSTLIDTIQKFSSRKGYLRKILKKPVTGSLISRCMHLIDSELSIFTRKTEEHLKELSFSRLWDRRLGTTREQYHLYMLEIECTNRLYHSAFINADRKIALLPYCLQDFSVTCKAAVKGFDYQCRHCSGKCFENRASSILEKYGIEPYIWRGSNFKQLASEAMKNGQHFAVFGIACIPELVWGMRMCRKHHIPVLGIALNANRCIRWFGHFNQNSVDLDELEQLVKV